LGGFVRWRWGVGVRIFSDEDEEESLKDKDNVIWNGKPNEQNITT
jgi:hypothetical protein